MRSPWPASGLILALACGSSGGGAPAAEAAKAAKEGEGERSAAKAEEKPPAPPPKEAPKAPEGSQVLGDLYVQICRDPDCPKALQPAGDAHCKGLKLGEGLTWRLPTIEEAKAFAGKDGLAVLEGFHWTASPFAEDDGQVWIFDPVGGQSTTIPRDRKPFTIRCVADIP